MKGKILVVDDEKAICDVLEAFLTKKGYEVVVASSAEEGIEKVKTEKPKVILLDIRMPGMSGVDAIKEIRKIDKDVAILMATAALDEEIARQTVKLGASDYIIKPFDLNYLEKSLAVKIATML